MREIITEDQLSGIRTITRIELTAQGIKRTMITEVMEPVPEDDVEYTNYDEEKSTLSGGGIFVYDTAVRTSSDGHRIYSFNDSVNMEFNMVFDCNDRAINDEYFYITHNVRDVIVQGLSFLEIDKYDDESKIVILCDNELVISLNISDISGENQSSIYINLGGYAKSANSRTKWEVYISGNTNPYARGKLVWNCMSTPPNGINVRDLIIGGLGNDENEPTD